MISLATIRWPRGSSWLRFTLALLVLVIAACEGGEDEEAAAKAEQKAELQRKIAERKANAAKKKAAKSKSSPDRTVQVRLKNPGWKRISPYFKRYMDRVLKNRFTTDVFMPHTDEMIPRPKLRDPSGNLLATEDGEAPKARKKLAHPLQAFDLKDISVVLIMTNVSRPKALVVGARGASYIVTATPPTPIGKHGGRIHQITQYDVLVTEKDEIKRLNSLKPQYVDLRRGSELSKNDSDSADSAE